MDFVSLHTHTTYSYGDGFGTVEEHVKRVAELGMVAVGITEHGNPNSHAALERHAKEHDIKPIFGLEAYFGPVGIGRTRQKTHLTILAQNQEGYHSLNKIITQSYKDFFHWPTVSPETLKRYNAGLIVLSGCSDSLISCTLLGGKFLGDKRDPSELSYDSVAKRNTYRRLQWFLDVFGPERFFLEVQRFPRLDRTCALNETFVALGKECGVSLAATADVHYPRPTDNSIHALLHAARWPSTKSDFQNDAAWEYEANLSYPESDEEIVSDLVRTGLTHEQAEQAILQTAYIARKCTVELPKAKPLRVRKPISGKTGKPLSAAEYLRSEINLGWKRRLKQRPSLKERQKEYAQRIKEELEVIVPKDFCDYFLATAELINYAKSEDVTVGPGRGSAAGSLVCYVMGITEIDPLHPTFSKMIFERFIDKNRSDMPDIDVDFDDELRWKIPAKARDIYGQENVANVANHNKYRARKAFQDVARAHSLPEKIFEPIANKCENRVETDERVDLSIFDAVTNYKNDPDVFTLLEQHGDRIAEAIELENNQHSMGVHAGGFVIASDPIPEVCAIITKDSGQGRNKRQIQVIPYEKRDAEHLGMLKMDFLGLATMGVIGKIRGWIGMNLDQLYSLYYEDYDNGSPRTEQILSLLRNDQCTGIFQYEGGTTRQVVRDVQPENFDEFAACNALSRPGPLYGGQTTEYIKVKRGEKDWKRIHPTGFDRHVEWTYGQIVYQEQIMWILRDLANFSTDRVLKVRKIIGKKLGEFQFAELWAEFSEGCASNGVCEADAADVWSAITTAAGYAFNTSHAYSYALVAWWLSYFKLENTAEFFAAGLSKNGDGKKDISRRTLLLQDAQSNAIKIGEFDPNVMDVQWQPGRVAYNKAISGGHVSVKVPSSTRVIVPGWCQVPDIGDTTANAIINFVKGHPLEVKWWHLINVKGIGEGTVMKIVEFVSQEDPFGIERVSKQLSTFRKQSEAGEFAKYGLPDYEQFYESTIIPDENNTIAFVGFAGGIVFSDEIEFKRKKTGMAVEDIKMAMDSPELSKKATVFAYDEHGEVALRVSRWKYNAVERQLAAIEKDHHIVVAWGRTFEGKPRSLQVTNLWVLDPD